jgi:hypothetical protein
MTTPAKTYQNISYQELCSFSKQNPNRHRSLESIEIRTSVPDPSLDSLYLTGYTSFNVHPAGILSIIACLADPQYYSLAPPNARMQQLIEWSTKLQQQTDDFKNTSLSRKRKKIYDLIAVSYNGGVFQEKDHLDLYHGLSIMTQQHFILMNEAVHDRIEDHEKQYESALKGEIFFSSDPTTWKQSYPVWVADYRGRWVAIPSEIHARPLSTILAEWLVTMEQKGWVVHWPEVDATKIELVDQLCLLPTWQETDRKLTKGVLSARLGRARSLQVFTSWMKKESSELK